MNFDEFFDVDKYPELNQKYFLPLRESGDIIADPSGWTDTWSNVGTNKLLSSEIQKYYSDFYSQLNPIKEKMLPLFSRWEEMNLIPENITLCHSATVGTAIILAFLVSKGIKNIIFETPCYFATFYQAETFGLNIIRIPTFHDKEYKLDIPESLIRKMEPCAIFLTQPRTALGLNQDLIYLSELANQIGERNYIIIDEATEQLFPSHLHGFNFLDFRNLIKIRSVFKGMGVNGVRLAYIIHHLNHRKELAEKMEVMQGALDINSLKLGIEMTSDIARFKKLLAVANLQIIELRNKAQKYVIGSNCKLSNIINGYIGSVAVKLQGEYEKNKFIEYCANMKMPVIIGSSMGFARHDSMEFIRLNYFNREHHILRGLEILSSFK